MKKYIVAIAIAALSTASFAQSSWQWGLNLGFAANGSNFTSGMSNASALFTQTPYFTGEWGAMFRKTVSEHWSFQTGINAQTLGFQYGMAQDYSLFHPFSQNQWNIASFGAVQIPLSAVWNSKLNCRNVRWFVGAGGSILLVGKMSTTNDMSTSSEAVGNTYGSSYLDQTAQSDGAIGLNAHLVFGVEKVLNSGRILNFSFWMSKGFVPIATSTVTYNAMNQNYSHTFTNYGGFVGYTATYYFRPFGSKAAALANAMKQAEVK